MRLKLKVLTKNSSTYSNLSAHMFPAWSGFDTENYRAHTTFEEKVGQARNNFARRTLASGMHTVPRKEYFSNFLLTNFIVDSIFVLEDINDFFSSI